MSKKEVSRDFAIPSKSKVKVKKAGNVTEILYLSKNPKGGVITKIDKDHYIDNRTGEIKEFKHNENRAGSIKSLENTMVKLRDMLNANVTVPENCRWLTLTYRDNMQNLNKLRRDFDNFNRRCRKQYGAYEYIAVAEPQGRGAWHLHVVIIFHHRAPYMENSVIAKLWGKGFVTIRKLNDIDNVGAYLTAYLGDIPIEEYQAMHSDATHFGEIKIVEEKEIDGTIIQKRYIKGARLPLYPSGAHFYRCSRGVLRPTVSYDTYENAMSSLAGAAMTYKCITELQDSESGFSCLLARETYNTKRKKEC